jgi:ABC-type lipoprotein release transport system permease subunit
MMFRIAWRNLWRNRTRTLIVISAISITYALFLISMGLSDSMYGKMETSAAQAAGGTVLVHADGYWAEQTNRFIIDDGDQLLRELQDATGADAVSGRLILNGLISTAETSMPIRLNGIDPERERAISDIDDYLDEGTFLSGSEDAPIVLPSAVANELKAELGDRIVITVTGPDGQMERALFHLTGTLDVGELGAAAGLGYTTLDAARKAVGIEGGALTQIGLLSSTDRNAFKESVERAIGQRQNLEVLTWAEAIPDLVGFIEMDRAFANVYGVLVFLVVVFSISNTFMMIVMERVRELGLLGAIGMTPGRIGWLVMLETIVLVAVALSVGFAVGFGLHSWVAANGIDLAAIYGDTEMDFGGVSMADFVVYSEIRVSRWINATLTVFGLVLLSAAYPAWRASKLAPADAMRYYG